MSDDGFMGKMKTSLSFKIGDEEAEARWMQLRRAPAPVLVVINYWNFLFQQLKLY